MKWLTVENFVLTIGIVLASFIVWAYLGLPDAQAATVTQIFNGGTATSTTPGYGKVLIGGKNGEYEFVATSTFGGGGTGAVSSVFGRIGVVTAQSGDYTTSLVTEGSNLYYSLTRWATALAGTTTDALKEGTNNLYYTNARSDARFVTDLAATTSVKSITTLSSLSLPYSQLTGAPTALSQFTNDVGYLLSSAFNGLFDNRLSATTSLPNITTLAALSLPISQTTGTLAVNHGGTGSTTLTGILKGSGTAQVGTAIGDTDYQKPISLTTTGSSGAATFSNDTLNIPQYAGTTYTATYPITLTASAFGLAFGTTTQNFWNAYNSFTSLSATNASSTNATTTGSLYLSGLTGSGGELGLDANNRVYKAATTTAGTGLTYNGTSFNVGGLTTTQFASANISQWTNNSGYLTSLAGAASSTLLADFNTFTNTQKFSTASTTNLIVSSAGGSGTRCLQVGADGTVSATSGACGVAGAGIQNIGPAGQTQSGTTQTLATSSATTISGLTVGLTIVGNSNTQTFTPNFSGSISGLTTGNFASANISQWTNNSGYLTSLAGAASSTLLGDTNTWSGPNTFASITFSSNPKFSALVAGGVASNGVGRLYNTATSTAVIGSGLAYTGTLGSFLDGIAGTLSVSGLTTANFASANISQFTNDSGYFNTTGAAFSTTSANYNFSTNLAATTSVKSIVTLGSLSLPYSQLTGTPTVYPYEFPAGATSTLLTFSGGFVSNGSTTVAGTLHLPLSNGELAVNTNAVYTTATTTFNAPLNYANGAVTLSTSGAWTGNAGTATALAANGTNCSAGNYPLGVDAQGNVENCTAAAIGTVTGVTGSFPIASSGGATPNLTWTGIASSSPIAAGGAVLYATGVNTFASAATTTASCTGNATCTAFTVIGSTPVTINVAAGNAASSTLLGDTNTFSGTDVFSNPLKIASLNGLIGGNNGNTYAVSTSSLNASITGNAATVTTNANLSGVITSSGNTTSFGSQSAGVLGNPATGNTGVLATSTLYGVSTPGFDLVYTATGLAFVATSTYSAPLVFANNNVTCSSASSGVTGCLTGTDWNTFNNKQPAGNYITALTGDVTASGPGSVAATLATVNSNVGSFTNASITVNGKGLVTAASSGAAPVTSVTATYPLASSGGTTPNLTTNFGTTTGWGIGNNGFFLSGPTGIPYVGASSTLRLPTSALASANVSQFTNDAGYDTFAYPFIASATTSAITFGGITVTGKADGCATFASGVLNSTGSACGTGGGATFGYPFINNATSTTLAFNNGLISNASSTFSSSVYFTAISNGELTVYGGLVSSGATTTAGTGLNYSGNAFNVNTSQNIATLSNLTGNGFVKTSGGTGALSIDTNTYLTGNQSITLSGVIGGSGATSITTTFTNATANTVLANATGASAAPTYIATSTFFGTGTPGQVIAWLNGVPTWTASTSNAAGTGISISAAGAVTTVTNTGVISNSCSSGITCSGTNPSNFSIGSNALTLAQLPTLAAGSIWANNTAATGNAVAIATSSLFGTGTGGKVLTWNNGVPQWVATTTYSGALSFLNGNVTVANNGVTLAMLPTLAANSIWANNTSATGNAVAIATSSIFSGTTGQHAYFGASGALVGTTSLFTASNQFIGIGTTTPVYPLTVYANSTSSLALSAGAGLAQWLFANEGGNFYLGTSTAGGVGTSTPFSAFSINGTGAPSLSIGSTTQTLSAITGLITQGSNGANGSSTISNGKVQFDTYNSAGTRVCAMINGTAWSISTGACTP